jgi:hypothetical protein
MLEPMAAEAKSEEIEKKPLMIQNHTCDFDLMLERWVDTDSSLSQTRNHQYWHAMRCDAAQWRKRLSARLGVCPHHVDVLSRFCKSLSLVLFDEVLDLAITKFVPKTNDFLVALLAVRSGGANKELEGIQTGVKDGEAPTKATT